MQVSIRPPPVSPRSTLTTRWAADVHAWPVAVLRIEHPGHGDAEVDQLIEAVQTLMARRQPYALVWDLHHMQTNAARRQKLVQWLKTHWDPSQSKLVSAAVVMPSTLQRNVATAFMWFVEPPCPVRMFATAAEAHAWSREQLEAHGLPSAP